jgi:hypothetical protein
MKLQSFFREAAAFFTEARYSTAATWLQTVLLGVTLIYTGAQLSQLIEQNKGPKREKFYSFQKDYKEHLADRIERVRRLAWRSRLPFDQVPVEQFHQEMAAVDVKTTLHDYVTLLDGLDDCLKYEVCDKEKSSDFLCTDAERTYLALNHDLKSTHQAEWEALQVWNHEAFFNEIIHENCGLFNRINFYIRL